ncbi:4'-phosphopantetheinyl transferase [Streptacidiphilus pinicola]|uniref:4'-phosphopantetheinyl transferase n=1 Tax=Streptacidiphilus pinicola TaxID=2219663 RepID=A0A2X0IKI8_9ACTN|nr:4'-phosphopantetheinyl transferase [Streptacidiphilus pinicola]
MLSELLPGSIRTAEAFESVADVLLFPEEQAVIVDAVEKRRREFATARQCARRALAALGQPVVPLLPGRQGAPSWPPAVVGSVTHCDGYHAAAVALRAEVASLGIDAEPDVELPDGVLEFIARPRERQQVAELTEQDPSLHWGRLLFSAKESVYKTWFPLTGQWLGFHEAELDINPLGGTFRVRLLREGRDPEGRQLHTFHGRWLHRRNLIVTAVAHI